MDVRDDGGADAAPGSEENRVASLASSSSADYGSSSSGEIGASADSFTKRRSAHWGNPAKDCTMPGDCGLSKVIKSETFESPFGTGERGGQGRSSPLRASTADRRSPRGRYLSRGAFSFSTVQAAYHGEPPFAAFSDEGGAARSMLQFRGGRGPSGHRSGGDTATPAAAAAPSAAAAANTAVMQPFPSLSFGDSEASSGRSPASAPSSPAIPVPPSFATEQPVSFHLDPPPPSPPGVITSASGRHAPSSSNGEGNSSGGDLDGRESGGLLSEVLQDGLAPLYCASWGTAAAAAAAPAAAAAAAAAAGNTPPSPTSSSLQTSPQSPLPPLLRRANEAQAGGIPVSRAAAALPARPRPLALLPPPPHPAAAAAAAAAQLAPAIFSPIPGFFGTPASSAHLTNLSTVRMLTLAATKTNSMRRRGRSLGQGSAAAAEASRARARLPALARLHSAGGAGGLGPGAAPLAPVIDEEFIPFAPRKATTTSSSAARRTKRIHSISSISFARRSDVRAAGGGARRTDALDAPDAPPAALDAARAAAAHFPFRRVFAVSVSEKIDLSPLRHALQQIHVETQTPYKDLLFFLWPPPPLRAKAHPPQAEAGPSKKRLFKARTGKGAMDEEGGSQVGNENGGVRAVVVSVRSAAADVKHFRAQQSAKRERKLPGNNSTEKPAPSLERDNGGESDFADCLTVGDDCRPASTAAANKSPVPPFKQSSVLVLASGSVVVWNGPPMNSAAPFANLGLRSVSGRNGPTAERRSVWPRLRDFLNPFLVNPLHEAPEDSTECMLYAYVRDLPRGAAAGCNSCGSAKSAERKAGANGLYAGGTSSAGGADSGGGAAGTGGAARNLCEPCKAAFAASTATDDEDESSAFPTARNFSSSASWLSIPPGRVTRDRVYLKTSNISEKLAVSLALAQSATLAVHESAVERALKKFSTVPRALAHSTSTEWWFRVARPTTDIRKDIASVYSILISANVVHDLLDIPEYFWDHGAYQHFWRRVHRQLEIQPRLENLNLRVGCLQDALKAISAKRVDDQSDYLTWLVILLLFFSVLAKLTEVFVYGK